MTRLSLKKGRLFLIKSILASLLFTLLAIQGVDAKQIEKKRSIYRNVVIVEEEGIRCMRFETRRKKVSNQACIDIKDQQKIVFEYVQGILAGYRLQPKPQRILIIGLGGGVLSNIMAEISPDSEIVNVDIDPVVVEMAKKYFDYKESKNVKTVIKDGRVFAKRALLKKESFDWIVLDAFNGDYIPEHLMTKEFLEEIKGLLSQGGILTANTFSTSKLYHHESVTYQKVFGDLQIYQAPTKGNRIIFACKCDNKKSFPQLAPDLVKAMDHYQFSTDNIWANIDDSIDWETDVEVLTDQYSPANLLKGD